MRRALGATNRGPRIAAVISIAGSMAMFTPTFFRTADVPLLMIAGTADVVHSELDRIRPPCLRPPPREAMDPARQHTITTLAVSAFLDRQFARDCGTRLTAARYLADGLTRDFPEVRVATRPDVR